MQLRFLMGRRCGFAFHLLLLKAGRRGTEADAETGFQSQHDWFFQRPYKTQGGGLRVVSKTPKQAKQEHDKEGSSASFTIFLSGEVTAVWICISGEGKGVSQWTKQPFRVTQQLAHTTSPLPSAVTEHF